MLPNQQTSISQCATYITLRKRNFWCCSQMCGKNLQDLPSPSRSHRFIVSSRIPNSKMILQAWRSPRSINTDGQKPTSFGVWTLTQARWGCHGLKIRHAANINVNIFLRSAAREIMPNIYWFSANITSAPPKCIISATSRATWWQLQR